MNQRIASLRGYYFVPNDGFYHNKTRLFVCLYDDEAHAWQLARRYDAIPDWEHDLNFAWELAREIRYPFAEFFNKPIRGSQLATEICRAWLVINDFEKEK